MVTVQIANMVKMGLSENEYKNPEYLAEYLSNLWNSSGKGRTCAVAVCVSADGLYHAHMALYGNTTTLNKVSHILFNSHCEPQLSGKKELTAYLMKQGKYAEKGEKILYVKDIEAIQDVQGKRSDLDAIEEMLLQGMTPQEILNVNFSYYRFEKIILHAYSDMRIHNAAIRQDIYVEYHVGESASGKTYILNQLCDELGADNIYVMTDYDNNASGGLDSYMKVGAPIVLFMDEFKGLGITFGKLLTMLNGYTRMQTHARYSNAYNLWNKVYITTVYPPEDIYRIMVDREYQNVDSYEQLIRRINKIVFHYKENEEYKTYSIDSKDYVNYEDLKNKALNNDGFVKISEEQYKQLGFDNQFEED